MEHAHYTKNALIVAVVFEARKIRQTMRVFVRGVRYYVGVYTPTLPLFEQVDGSSVVLDDNYSSLHLYGLVIYSCVAAHLCEAIALCPFLTGEGSVCEVYVVGSHFPYDKLAEAGRNPIAAVEVNNNVVLLHGLQLLKYNVGLPRPISAAARFV